MSAGVVAQRTVPVIELEDIHKNYAMGDASVHALCGVDLRILRGEFVAIMGPSGSGKTTLMEVMGCLSSPSAGSYHLKGRDVSEIGHDGLAQLRGEEIGSVFQSFNLLPRVTVLENVELPLSYRNVSRRERRERATHVLERVGLEHRARHRPNEISGGERQRVAIARALINHPALVLADEPTGNLDSHTSAEIMDLLCDLHEEGNTVVVVTHDLEIAKRAERMLTIRDGRFENAQVAPNLVSWSQIVRRRKAHQTVQRQGPRS